MDRYETDAKYNLAKTCYASISPNDLLTFSAQETKLADYAQKQVYGAIPGSNALRSNIASLYSVDPILPGHILVMNGAIQAIFSHYTPSPVPVIMSYVTIPRTSNSILSPSLWELK